MGKGNFLWPSVDTIENAKSASRYGIWAATFSAAITTLLATWALGAGKKAFDLVDAWGYLDAAIGAAVAYGIYRESRFAAVFGLAYFLYGKATQFAYTGQMQGAWIAIILTLCYVISIRGVYALRKLRTVGAALQSSPVDSGEPRR